MLICIGNISKFGQYETVVIWQIVNHQSGISSAWMSSLMLTFVTWIPKLSSISRESENMNQKKLHSRRHGDFKSSRWSQVAFRACSLFIIWSRILAYCWQEKVTTSRDTEDVPAADVLDCENSHGGGENKIISRTAIGNTKYCVQNKFNWQASW